MNSIKKRDRISKEFESVLREHYLPTLDGAHLDVYRAYGQSIWIRVIHPSFHGKRINQRDAAVWPILFEHFDEKTLSMVTKCYLLSPDELDSPMNDDFENPSPLLA